MSDSFLINLSKVSTSGEYVDLEELARLEGIEYEESDEYKDEFSGLIKKMGDRYRIIVNKKHTENRKRFSLAHELAHYYLHKDEIERAAIVDDGLYRSGRSEATEFQANSLAARILMPESLIVLYLKEAKDKGIINSKETLEGIAKRLRVSRQALAIRLGIPFD